MFVAESLTQFKDLFVVQLKNMLADDELGAFILVLANSLQDDFLREALHEDIQRTFVSLKENFASVRLTSAADDVAVFEQLLAMDIEGLSLWQCRTTDSWEVVLNEVRKLRPARVSSQVQESISLPFDESKFHFNKPFLTSEILWQGRYQEVALRVLYNKFPFSDYHLLIAFSPQQNLPQVLTADSHRLMFSLAEEQARLFFGFGIGFNSLAAGASVNHLHFQAFVRDRLLPIENNNWKHNGGDDIYPLTVMRFVEVEAAWLYIDALIVKDRAFNCIYRQSVCYVVPRVYQGRVDLPGWLQGAGWLDVAGVMTVSDEHEFSSITAASVTKALTQLIVC